MNVNSRESVLEQAKERGFDLVLMEQNGCQLIHVLLNLLSRLKGKKDWMENIGL